MKKIILIIAISIAVVSSCKKKDFGQRGNACISANKISVASNEQITISNCGDELPSSRVETQLDWGDGTITDGQTGTHTYDTTGTYNIRLFLNGAYAADVTEVEESKVNIQITVN